MLRNRILVLSLIIGILGAASVAIFRDGEGSLDVGAAERQEAVSNEGTDVGFTLLHKGGERKLQSPLAQISGALGAYGPEGADIVAQNLGIAIEGGVRVVVKATPGEHSSLLQDAASLGLTVEATSGDLIQMKVPVESLVALAARPGIATVRLPLRAFAADVITGKGVAAIGATDWHAAGFTGAGSRIAVLDLGFDGYEELLGSELPDSVTVHSCREDGDITGDGQPHGTAVAEIVHEVAPEASLYFTNFDTEVEFANCIDWLVAEGVDVVNMSVGFFASGPGDGTGVVNDMVNEATSQGLVWVNSAGNEAETHWLGPWDDPDADDFLNFELDDETTYVDARAGEFVTIVLKWDDEFETSCNDYDLYLFDPTITTIVAGSEDFQDFCTSGIESVPVEAFSYQVPETGRYHIAVGSFVSDGQATFHLYSLNHRCPILQRCVAAGSLLEPADNPEVLAVGAAAWNELSQVEDFSSRGPTDDGRTKPDLTAPDGVSNVTFGSFFGTSASAAHTSGAAGLIKQWQPEWSQEEIRASLVSRAIDLAEPGVDDSSGSGLLHLGMPKPTPTPTATPTPTNTPTPTPTATPSPTPTPIGPPGDVDCDRLVTVRDAAIVLQFIAGLLQALPCEGGSDVNGDGHIDANDVIFILWLHAGILG